MRGWLLASLCFALALWPLGSGRAIGAGRAIDADPWPACRDCNVLLISIDTLRADHLGCYGYKRRTSPNLDRFARGALLFERAYSTSYVTADSHMSVFTSTYPSVHGVRNVDKAERAGVRLRAGVSTLTEVFAQHGYITRAVTGGGNIDAVYGFDRGMQSYSSPTDERVALEQARRFLRKRHAAPFFFFFHTYHAHDPYTPSQQAARLFSRGYTGRVEHDLAKLDRLRIDDSFADARRVFWSLVDKSEPRDVAQIVALYDAEVREVDWQVGELIRLTRERAPNTLIVLMSDHGEQFGEHGGFLHNDLYEELIHVPFVISHPRVSSARRVAQRVSLIDLAPSVLDIVGLPAPAQFQGRSLRGLVAGAEPARDIFAEKAGKRAALIQGDHKTMIWFREGGDVARLERYDLARDAAEQGKPPVPLGREAPPELSRVLLENSRRYAALGETAGNESGGGLGADTIERLKALGYLE